MMSDDHGWWVRIGDVSRWVADTPTLHSWVREDRLSRHDLVFDPETSRWIRAADVRELRDQFYPLGFPTRWRYDLFVKLWPLYVVVAFFIGLVCILGSLEAGCVDSVRSLLWTKTDGVITRSDVSVESEKMVSGTVLTWYRPEIRYEYRLGNHRYESDRIDFAPPLERSRLFDRKVADGMVSRYPAGQRLTVYVDAAHPDLATLDRGEASIVVFLIGVVITVGATLVLRLWWRRRERIAKIRASM
jgi:hypothetical protein